MSNLRKFFTILSIISYIKMYLSQENYQQSGTFGSTTTGSLFNNSNYYGSNYDTQPQIGKSILNNNQQYEKKNFDNRNFATDQQNIENQSENYNFDNRQQQQQNSDKNINNFQNFDERKNFNTGGSNFNTGGSNFNSGSNFNTGTNFNSGSNFNAGSNFYDRTGQFDRQSNRNRYSPRFREFSDIGILDYDDGYNQNYCPEHWLAHDRTCYRFVNSPRRSWLEAQKICHAYKSDLVHLDRIDKHSYILRYLIQTDLRQNRYWVAAISSSPRNWQNTDGTAFPPNLEQFISYENLPINDNDNLNSDDLWKTQGLLNSMDAWNSPDINRNISLRENFGRNYSPLEVGRQNYGIGQKNYPYNGEFMKNRLVYAYSIQNDRWMLIPTYEFETNLFICQSRELYSIENLNILEDEKRHFDFGVEIKDFKKIPRGPYFVKQPEDTTYVPTNNRKIDDISLSCLANGYPTPTYRWYKEEYHNDILKFIPIDPILDDRYTLSGGQLYIAMPTQTTDQGSYHCVATNSFGSIRSQSAQLNFGFINEFNLKRSGETSDLNWGKVLFCDPPQHFPSVNYYWNRNFPFNFVDEDQRVFVSNDGALYFSSTESVDRANYSCSVQSVVSSTGRTGPFFPLRVRPKSDYQSLIFANSFPKVFPDAPIAGTEVRLECVGFGYPVPSYNWTRVGHNLPAKSYQINFNRVLIIPYANSNDNGEYKCTLSNQRLSKEKSLFLNIQSKPTFSIPLRDKIKDLNSEVRLICEAFGVPDVNYTWYKNAEEIKLETLNLDRVQIQDNILTIKYLQPDQDNGMYQCRAENQLSAVYSSAQLTVVSMKPSFKKFPLEPEIYSIYNGNVTLKCDPEAAPRPKFSWKKDGNVISSGGHRRIDQISGMLMIAPISRDDEGIYTCVATNELGSDESQTRLIVLQELRFTKVPEPRIITQVGNFIYLECDVQNDEILDVAFEWRWNGRILRDKFDTTGRDLQHNENMQENSRDFRNIGENSPDWGQNYKKHQNWPRNQKFSERNTRNSLNRGQYGNNYGRSQSSYNFMNNYDGGNSDYQYNSQYNRNYRDNFNEFNQSSNQFYSTNPQISDFSSQSARFFIDPNTLTILNVTTLDSGEYECIVWSAVGKVSAKTMLIVEGPPGPPGGVQVIEIGKTKALIEWIAGSPNGRPILFYNALGRTNWNKTWNLVASGIQAYEIERYSGRMRAEVTGLTPWSGYEFSVAAVNDLGVGTSSAPSPVYNTHEDIPYIAPRNVGGGGGKVNDLMITWDPLKSQEQNSHGIHYKVFWKLKGTPEWASDIRKSQANIGIAVVNLPTNKNLYYTEFDVKVQARNNVGYGPESESVVIFSAEDMPQVAPQQVLARGFNSTALNVTWNPIEMTREKIRGKLIGHRLKYWKKDIMAEEDATYYLSRTTKNWALIVGLEPDTYYFVKVMAYNSAGEGPESERYIERTYRKPPQKPPSSVFVDGINPSTIRVVWRYISPSQEEEPIEGYKVRVWESDQDMITANNTIIRIGSKLEAYIDNLVPGKSYNLRVLAYSNGGDGRMSSPTSRFQMGKTARSSSNTKLIFKNLTIFSFILTHILYKMRSEEVIIC